MTALSIEINFRVRGSVKVVTSMSHQRPCRIIIGSAGAAPSLTASDMMEMMKSLSHRKTEALALWILSTVQSVYTMFFKSLKCL